MANSVWAALVFCVGLVVAELLLTVGSADLFWRMNADILPDSFSGLLADHAVWAQGAKAIHARMTWFASVIFVNFVAIGAVIFAVTRILKESPSLAWKILPVLLVLIFVSALVASRSDVSRELLQDPILIPTIGSFVVGGIDMDVFSEIRRVTNALIAAATVAVVVALAVRASLGLVLQSRTDGGRSVEARMADMHQLLFAGALLLVSVIITMVAWLNWPTAGLVKDSEAHDMIAEIALGVGLYWGVVFSLSLALAYIPCVTYLHFVANRLSEADGQKSASANGDIRGHAKVLFETFAMVSPFASALLPVFLA